MDKKLREKILRNHCTENDINSATDLDTVVKHQLLAELHFALKDFANARKYAEQCSEVENEDQWRGQLILAKLSWIADDDADAAEDELRELCVKNPNVPEILEGLAEFYVAFDELDYAKKCVEHAIILNPSNQSFRELQDSIYAKLKVPIEERILKLNEFITLEPYSMWAVRRVTVLEVQNGRFDEAINKLRRVIHALPEDVDIEIRKDAAAIWAYVGLINFYRGQAKSAMYAFESAVSLQPENASYLIQLALSQKNLYKFEEAFATLKKLRSVKEVSPEIRKQSHFLFLETIALYAEQLTPGEKQLQQLLTLFKIVGEMPISDWWISRALSFAVANALALFRKYNKNIVDAFLLQISEFARKCGIARKEDILNAEIAIMLNMLSNEKSIGAINEAGIRMLENAYADEKNAIKLASIAGRFFRKAILLPAQKAEDRSMIYLNLGLTFCIGTVNYEKALHCFLRSLQLNKNNPSALSLVGFLCLKKGDIKKAAHAFNKAQILEPLQVQHWLGRAMLSAEDSNITAVINNFQHSLTIKPCTQAVEAFSYYLEKAKADEIPFDKFDFDSTTIQHLLYVNEPSDNLLRSRATVVEHFEIKKSIQPSDIAEESVQSSDTVEETVQPSNDAEFEEPEINNT